VRRKGTRDGRLVATNAGDSQGVRQVCVRGDEVPQGMRSMQSRRACIDSFSVHYAHDVPDLLGRNMRAHRFSE
jgi:hypothetical protein